MKFYWNRNRELTRKKKQVKKYYMYYDFYLGFKNTYMYRHTHMWNRYIYAEKNLEKTALRYYNSDSWVMGM